MKAFGSTIASALLAAGACSEPIPRAPTAPTVDLGYSVYQGSYDSNNSINVFKGIRYAAPPLGDLRFAAPQAPAKNTTTTLATNDPPICPQTGISSQTPAVYGFGSGLGNEDCLFLNVYAPANAKNLPVFFWIHGGGYGVFSAKGLDPTEIMKTNNNGFISVIIQYRLGAFGFLSGDAVKKDGALNAGLLDMNFALKWVQSYIGKFGGDPNRVTLAGESAGGGAVLYQSLAYGGQQKECLFQNVIAASPYLPYQHNYDDPFPTKAYSDFVENAGCTENGDALKCLRAADSVVLQNASAKVSEAGPFGTFAFTPVTDGNFVRGLPSQGLSSKAVQGKRILSTNMADEGVPLAPPTTQTLQDFRDYIDTTFPNFSESDKDAIEKQYSYKGDDQPINPNAADFATSGTGYPTAVNVSSYGTGQEQRVFDVFAEYAFVCPSYWAASAFSHAWKYQFSMLPSYHGYDLQALWSGTPTPGASVKLAFRKIWGNFIINNSPVISVADAKGGVANSSVPPGNGYGDGGNIKWPQWDANKPTLLNFNSTGGLDTHRVVTPNLSIDYYSDPGVSNQISLADATSWEGGRGKRCDFWKSMAPKIPY